MLKDSFNYYHDQFIKIEEEEALNITALVGDKGTRDYERCDGNGGRNLLSVMFVPG